MTQAPQDLRPEARPPLAARYEPNVHKVSLQLRQRTAVHALWRLVQSERTDFDASTLERVLWHGGLFVDGHRVVDDDAVAWLEGGAKVTIYWFSREPEPVVLSPDCVCWRDEAAGVWAVNKPAWLPVQGTRASARYSFEYQVQQLFGEPGLRPAHRLDRATSGVVLFAAHREAARVLGKAFIAGRVEKAYLAWVCPAPARGVFTVEGFMRRGCHPRHTVFEMAEGPGEGYRHSHTDFEVLERRGELALVRAWPRTGRTHQIRVHLASAGSPIVADGLYGPPWRPDAPWPAQRLQLHAEAISVTLADGRPLHARAPLPRDWLGVDAGGG